ncbi:hypothetical protein NC652_015129 [Populus alba x Populus x berolinensis]|nr:hypothetical protein NC652_015129 [Populus alba x Populus x berolinensis]
MGPQKSLSCLASSIMVHLPQLGLSFTATVLSALSPLSSPSSICILDDPVPLKNQLDEEGLEMREFVGDWNTKQRLPVGFDGWTKRLEKLCTLMLQSLGIGGGWWMGARKIENPKCHCNTPGLFTMISFTKNKPPPLWLPPSSYFHYTKYAKHHSPTPPPRYPNNLNFHHHSNFLEPPPPPQTPPPPPSFPQFSPRNPHFSYNPSPNHPQIHDNYNHQRSHHDLPHSTQLPWVSHQLYDDLQPPRRLPEFDHCVHEPRPNFTFLRDDHMQTRHELEGDPNPNSRLDQDRNVVTDGESEHCRRRVEFGSNSDRSSF